MTEKKYIIRNYRPDDFSDYLAFYLRANPVGRSGLFMSPKLLFDELNFPRRSPEKNLFISESQGKIIGFCELIPEISIGRVLVNAMVHPRFKKHGIGSALFAAALSRAKELRADIVHVDIRSTNKAAANFLENHGFEVVRRYRELRLNRWKLDGDGACPHRYDIRPMDKGQEHLLAMIQNLSFTGSWGFHPNTVDEIRYMINQFGCAQEDVLLAFSGEHPVGYCWTRVNREANARQNAKIGRIHMMGVDPDHRGEGIARLILLAGLKKLEEKGIETVELTVDSANQPALRLYRSVCFKRRGLILWYERPI
jgi:mycothiol synthase